MYLSLTGVHARFLLTRCFVGLIHGVVVCQASAARTNIISILNACLELRVLFQLHVNPYLQSLRTATNTTTAHVPVSSAKSCIDRINELRSSFRSRVRFLVVICSQLVEHGLHPELGSLINGLNFNSFYTNENDTTSKS